VAIVRSMPNTPSQLGAGMTGLIANEYTTEGQKTQVSELFSSIGHFCVGRRGRAYAYRDQLVRQRTRLFFSIP